MSVSLTDLMKELQAGEEARAKVPQLIAANDDLAKRLDNAQFHNGTLEGNIIGYKQQIDALSAKVRSLEVERDDAGFRELEAADKLNTLLQFVRGVAHDVDNTVRSIDPPKPEPTPQPVVQNAPVPVTETQTIHQPETPTIGASTASTNIPITDHGAESAANPTAKSEGISSQTASFGPAQTTNTALLASSPGQSDPLPSAPSTAPTLSSASGPAVEPSATAVSTSDLPYSPFEGAADGESIPPLDYPEEKRWYNKPAEMSSADWVASGGQA